MKTKRITDVTSLADVSSDAEVLIAQFDTIDDGTEALALRKTNLSNLAVALQTVGMNADINEALIDIQDKLDAIIAALVNYDKKPILYRNVTVTPEMFSEDDIYQDYPYAVTIMLEASSENCTGEVIFNIEEATSGNFAPIADTGDGYVRLYSKVLYDKSFVINYIKIEPIDENAEGVE